MQLLYIIVQRFRGGLAFKAHRLLYHTTLGLRVIKKKRAILLHLTEEEEEEPSNEGGCVTVVCPTGV